MVALPTAKVLVAFTKNLISSLRCGQPLYTGTSAGTRFDSKRSPYNVSGG